MRRYTKSDGFTLLNFILIVALVSIMSAVVSSVFDAFFVQQKYAVITSKRQELYYDVISSISDDTAWKNTVDHLLNVSLDCLKDPVAFPTITEAGNCSATSGGKFNLYDRNGSLVVDTLTTTAGFQISGGVCNDFAASGNDHCPFRVELTWAPLCPTCYDKQIQIDVLVRYVPTPESRRPAFTKNYTLVKNISMNHNAVMVAVGFRHTCAVMKNGVYCWGTNQNGELAQPAAVWQSSVPLKVAGLDTGVTAISVGYADTCVIHNGNAKCWGRNFGAVSGVNNGGLPVRTPQAVMDNTYASLSNVTDISVGVTHSCAISNGAAFCWGSNADGALGMSEAATLQHNIDTGSFTEAQPVLDMGSDVKSIAAAWHNTCATKNDGSVKCWGSNDEKGGNRDVCAGGIRQLGVDPPDGSYKVCSPYVVEGLFLPLSAPGDPSWGNSYSSCATPTTVAERHRRCNPRPIQTFSFPPGSGAERVVGAYGYCVLVGNPGVVKCWGDNQGKLGLGTTIPGYSLVALQVITLTDVTMIGALQNGYCAVNSGKLYCWGYNGYPANRLGIPPSNCSGNSCPTPTQVAIPGTVSYFSGGGKDQGDHACAVSDERVFCWGSNSFGQLGDGTIIDRPNSYTEVTKF